jgi:hypothetical protein
MIDEERLIKLLKETIESIREITKVRFLIRDKESTAKLYYANLRFIPPIGSIIKLPYCCEDEQKYIVESIFIDHDDNGNEEVEILVGKYYD